MRDSPMRSLKRDTIMFLSWFETSSVWKVGSVPTISFMKVSVLDTRML